MYPVHGRRWNPNADPNQVDEQQQRRSRVAQIEATTLRSLTLTLTLTLSLSPNPNPNPNQAFALYGGFVYLNENSMVIAANP